MISPGEGGENVPQVCLKNTVELSRQPGGCVTSGNCPPGFTLEMAMEHDGYPHHHVGTSANQNGADESVRLAAEYVKEHLAAILGTPEITKGDVLALS